MATAAKQKKSIVSSSSLPVAQIRYRIVGVSPLLCNNPASMLVSRSGGPKVGGTRIPTPEEEATNGLYLDDALGLYLPTAAFRNSLLQAARAIKYKPGGRGREQQLKTLLQGILFAIEDRTPLLDPETWQPLDRDAWEISKMRAVPPGQGAVLRSRPMFRRWGADVLFEYATEYAPNVDAFAEVVLNAFRRAGVMVGVGNYRPEKNGPFGRYTVEVLP